MFKLKFCNCAAACLLGVFIFQTHVQQLQAAESKPGAEEMVELQFPSATIPDILSWYEKISGKTLIRDANIQPTGNLSIVAPGKIPRSQALRLLESVMQLNGYTLVAGDDNSVKVINSLGGKVPRSEGIPVYANLEDLPKGDQLVSYFMPFRYLSAQEAAQIFQTHLPPHPAYGAIVPATTAQALIITENASAVRQLVKLRDLVDVPPAKVVSEFVSLQRADAERVADTITKMIDARKSKAAVPPGTAPAPDLPATAGMTLNERSLVTGDVQLTADARTNRILVVTRPANFEYMKGLIEQFDQAVTLTAPLERPLNYVTASEVLPVLETMLMESKDTQPVTANTPGGTQPGNRPNTGAGTTNRAGSGSSRVGSSATADRTLQENQDTAPDAVMVGKTRLVADKQNNSIIVIGPPESVERVKSILDRLDKNPFKVYISAVIGQLTLGKSSELSVDLLQKFTQGGSFGVASSLGTRSSGPVPEPSALTTAAAFASPIPAALTVYGAIGSTLNYYVKALESTNRFRLLSRPVIYTTNNKGAVISSGQRIAVPTSTATNLGTTGTSSNSVVSNIDYTDVVLKLEVVPTINSDRRVSLKIKQTNDSVVGHQTISGNEVPTIGTQSIDTTISVPDKATIVLGGLITENDSVDVTGIPILKDIPLLGYLFKGTTKDKTRSELVVLIQPSVVGTDDELKKVSAAEENRNAVGAEAHAFSENQPFDAKKHEAEVKAAAKAAKRAQSSKGGRDSETPPQQTVPPSTEPGT